MYWMDLSTEQIEEVMASFGAPKFRSKQVEQWLRRGVRPMDMTNLPLALRQQMDTIPFGGATIYQKHLSKGTAP